MKVFLVGFMGSGKSTLGTMMARKMGYEFVDLDHYIVKQEKMSIAEIFATRGEQYFRDCERKYLRQVSAPEGDRIISTGGGTPSKGDNMEYMRSQGTVIYLKLEPAMLRDRLLCSNTVRPLIEGKSPEELLHYIEDTLAEREKYYLKANLIVANIGRDVEKIIKLLTYNN